MMMANKVPTVPTVPTLKLQKLLNNGGRFEFIFSGRGVEINRKNTNFHRINRIKDKRRLTEEKSVINQLLSLLSLIYQRIVH